MYSVLLTDVARRFYEHAETALQHRLDRCFRLLAQDPFRHPNIKLLRAQWTGFRRFRLGDYRIVYAVDEARQTLVVAVIAHRREVYE